MARTAVVAGTATAVSNRVSRRQSNRWAAKEQSSYAEPQYAEPQYAQPQYVQPAPPPAPAPAPDFIEQLKELAALKNQGILTDAEFEAQKAKILAS
jgi:hypothetical protein